MKTSYKFVFASLLLGVNSQPQDQFITEDQIERRSETSNDINNGRQQVPDLVPISELNITETEIPGPQQREIPEDQTEYDFFGNRVNTENPDKDTVEVLPPPSTVPQVVYKAPSQPEFTASGDQYGKIVTEQMKDREALNNLGYRINTQ